MLDHNTQRPVGRPREFDEDAALEAVMDVFWEKGFESTSLMDLCEATGLHKGSLYQAFGDKRQLFIRALMGYAEREYQEVSSVISDQESPLTNFRAVIEMVCYRTHESRGCLMINSVVELCGQDPKIQEIVQGIALQRLKALTDMITAAQMSGEIRPELDPEILAKHMMITLAGAATATKGLLDRESAYQAIQSLIDYWL